MQTEYASKVSYDSVAAMLKILFQDGRGARCENFYDFTRTDFRGVSQIHDKAL